MRGKNDPGKKSTGVQSVSRALEILLCLGKDIHSLAGIADYCKLSKSTVHRLLKTLEESYFVLQDPINQQYYFGTSDKSTCVRRLNR